MPTPPSRLPDLTPINFGGGGGLCEKRGLCPLIPLPITKNSRHAFAKADCGRRRAEMAIAQGYRLDDRGFESRQGLGIFSSQPRPDRLWGPPSPIQWAPGALSLGVKLTTHLHLVPSSRMRGAIPPFPNTSSWRGAQLKKAQEQLYISWCSYWILVTTNKTLWIGFTDGFK
jgi:hypothetical protein